MQNRRVAFVTTIMPETHYSRYLLRAINSEGKAVKPVIAYVEDDREVLPLPGTRLIPCWRKGVAFPFTIMAQCSRDRISLVHLQHEFNMYGGIRGGLLFPIALAMFRIRMKTLVTIHSVFPTQLIDQDFLTALNLPSSSAVVVFAKLFFAFFFTFTGKLASSIIVHTETMRNLLVQSYRTNPNKVLVIPHGITPPSIATHEATDRKPNHSPILLYFGYVVRRKGLEYLIDAFAKISSRYPEVSVVLAGGTQLGGQDYVQILKKRISDLDLEGRIRFTGFINESAINDLFQSCEVVILPYVYSISASGPLSLAVTFRKPIVATNLSNLAEEVLSSNIGLLVPPRDVESLANAISLLLSEPQLRGRLSDNAATFAQQRSWERVAQQTISLYQSILASSTANRGPFANPI